ncbi:hypothetical protein NML04_07450 [Clostridium perfringens]|uniref:hypothetical protein n=1 Tax=Clostridium perfringens TaxID=1502 RepID=UPI000D9C3574|nr:hypothetical protein [Clostridium perfringens]MCO6000926.1 hypothetical protein [Clostridium perfringens]MCO7393539.1 hypothetical protein [Clostridium perfringens]MCP8915529.1 hypothetical protein [Clostridium perfringens]MCP8965384.1 hypothetical protein [Clostridium perfringens]MDU4116946.1 hypothetical protein [Clostridium perfringens]
MVFRHDMRNSSPQQKAIVNQIDRNDSLLIKSEKESRIRTIKLKINELEKQEEQIMQEILKREEWKDKKLKEHEKKLNIKFVKIGNNVIKDERIGKIRNEIFGLKDELERIERGLL